LFLYYAASAFTIWMIVDAIRRRAEYYWYLIILFVPFGSLIYFALVKVKDWNFRRSLPGAGQKGILRLRSKLAETPSVANKLELADALESSERFDEAEPLFREVLSQDPDNLQSLHGLARCAMSDGRFVDAVEHLEKLLSQDNAYRDYSAALDYAEALWQNGQRDDTIEVLEGLVAVSTRVNHHVALAHYLNEDGRIARAREVLERGLANWETSPDFVQRRDEKWARRAKKMLAEV
jgi:hypothetical protein